ncbi:MAG: TonB-dependent receptor [Pseudomonadota bacterium]
MKTGLLATSAMAAMVASTHFTTPAQAQGTGDAMQAPGDSVGPRDFVGIEEITVTARRREERLQETPIAISAFSGSELEARNLTNLAEVGAFIPNVVMSTAPGGSGGGSNLQVYIRGIGQTDFLFTTDPGVGVYIDGVYHPRTLGGVLDLLDLARIEVLRGPQGTLFGKNTIGGAISVVSAKPKGDGSGSFQATTGRFDRIDIRGGFDFAITDTLFAKVAASSKDRDGYGKRLEFGTDKLLDRTGDENKSAARIALRWLASERVTVDLAADYSRTREKSVPTALMAFDLAASPVAQLWNALVADPFPMSTAFITGDPFISYGTGPNRNLLDAYGFGLTIDWDLGNDLALKSITAYREMDAGFGRDGDGSPNSFVHTNQNQNQRQISEEIQLSGRGLDNRLNWLMGAFFFSEFGRDQNAVRLASGLFDALEGLPGPLDGSPLNAPTAPGGPGNPINTALDLDFSIFNEIKIKSYAAFAQATFDMTDRLGLTAGIRYSYETKDYTLDHQKINSGVPIFTGEERDSWGSFTPMGTLDYQWRDDVLTYFTVSRGFKSGGFNGRPINEGSVSSFRPEYVTSFELGAKTQWLDRRVQLNLAAFYNNYTDIQLSSVSADENGILQLLVQNAGKARVKGFEAELTARPTQRLTLTAALGYTDFNIVKLAPNVVDVTLDTRWPKTPAWTAAASAEYTIPMATYGFLALRGDWTYQSKTYQEPSNEEAIAQDGYSLFGARLVFAHEEGGWELAVFGTNLTDKRYIVNGLSAISSFGTAEAFFARPREWGLSLKKTF